MNHQTTFHINEPAVIAEEIEDEVIILNFDSGSYYSLNENAMGIWRLLHAGYSWGAMLAAWQATSGQDREGAAAAFTAFIEELQQESLIIPSALTAGPADAPALAVVNAAEGLVIKKFTDLQNLLVLDPIHEVNEMGWPHPAL
jgi:hypothetical protein